MERGSYSRLDQINQIQIELTEQSKPASFTDEPNASLQSGSTQEIHTDYVLVYESLKDFCELDEESIHEIRKRTAWRNTFESCLENKFGLVLQRKVVAIEEVSCILFAIYLLSVESSRSKVISIEVSATGIVKSNYH